MWFFNKKQTSRAGIDIGTSGIKVAEVEKKEGQFYVKSYGKVDISYDMGRRRDFDAITQTAEIIKQLMRESRISTKKVVASLPNSIVFVTMIELPDMSEKQLADAVKWEAKRYVPLPLDEVTLSWSVLRDDPSKVATAKQEDPGAEAQKKNLVDSDTAKKLKVLLTAVPTNVIDNYLKMFSLAGLEPEALEIEALALIRSLVGGRRDSFIIVDIGAQNTSVNLVDETFLRISRNLSIGSETISKRLSENMNISFSRAERFKKDLDRGTGDLNRLPQSVRSVLENIKNETGQLLKIYKSGSGSVQEIILAGSGSQLPGLDKYFSELGVNVVYGDPLKFVTYNPAVKEHINKMSDSLSVAIGLAMRE